MRSFKKYIVILCGVLLIATAKGFAQDPHYTQFFATPYLINPAYTGVFSSTVDGTCQPDHLDGSLCRRKTF
jgi:hypothetical protein